MIKKSTRTETRQVEDIEYICDLCGKKADASYYSAALKKCAICGLEVCRPCRKGTDDLTEIYYSGDRPMYRICIRCIEVGKPYQSKINALFTVAHEKKAEILKEWKAEANKGEK